MQALYQQLFYEIEHFTVEKNSIETVFIGGGTPSTVSAELYAPIFELIKPYLTQDAEITSEANPNSATKEWQKDMLSLGVNRLSFGVQSFNEKKLKLLNRAHTPQMAVTALHNAKELGFKNISLDLIYATQGDTKGLLEHDIQQAFSLPINHLSAYALTIEEGTPFAKKPQMAQEELALTEWLFASIEAHGFTQYEISNFGSYRSRHNLGYWEYKEYIGAGAGAVGKKGHERFYPNPDIEAYIANPLAITTETLTQEDARLERIFLGFRSCVGVASDILTQEEKIKAATLLEAEKLFLKETTLYNPNYLLADELALFLSS